MAFVIKFNAALFTNKPSHYFPCMALLLHDQRLNLLNRKPSSGVQWARKLDGDKDLVSKVC